MRSSGREPRRRSLRTGFSTGTAATAASQGALQVLLGQPAPAAVEVELPGGGALTIPLAACRRAGAVAECRVIKDAGDDPDVTHGAEIGARVWYPEGGAEGIVLRGGEGVGRVTKPGLPVAVGEAAINPVPRRMILAGVHKVWNQWRPGAPPALAVEIFVPRGEELARRTLNPRLGIVGGISILGTTGLVKPFSHAAYRATIAAALRVARAQQVRQVVLTTGGRSESYARRLHPGLPEEAFVQMGDYVAFAIRLVSRMEFARLTVAAFFGKAVKMAQGMAHTHAHKGPVDLERLGRWTREETGDEALAAAVRQANTARGALEALTGAGKQQPVAARVGEGMLRACRSFATTPLGITAMILDFSGRLLWQGATPQS